MSVFNISKSIKLRYPIKNTEPSRYILKECPRCKGEIWGEGWNPETGERFYSHTTDSSCCNEISHSPSGTLKFIVYSDMEGKKE